MSTTGGSEVEIKFEVDDAAALASRLRELGFRQETPLTHEINAIYDRAGGELRSRGELLRLRRYGEQWKFTYKGKAANGRHKTRPEIETEVADGNALDGILVALGFTTMFRYEKFRSEWNDGTGEVVIDLTPIGNLAEIEGPPEWIDSTAHKLGVGHRQFITKSYATLFFEWKSRTGSPAANMTFEECGAQTPEVEERGDCSGS